MNLSTKEKVENKKTTNNITPSQRVKAIEEALSRVKNPDKAKEILESQLKFRKTVANN